MGNYWSRTPLCADSSTSNLRLTQLLQQAIKNRLLKISDRNVEILRLENIFVQVRECAGQTVWETLVQNTVVCIYNSDLSRTFEKIVQVMTKDSFYTSPYHVLSVYALFADVCYYLPNDTRLNLTDELIRLHRVIDRHTDSSLLTQVLNVILGR